MKAESSKRLAVAIATVTLMVACGGGDESAGSLTPFSIQPTSLTLTAPNCTGRAGVVFVYGGAGPYRLDSTGAGAVVLRSNNDPDPNVIEPITNSVSGPGGSFEVEFTGPSCVNPASVIVVDQTGKQVVLTLTSTAS
jgi:hypothetical protein